MTTYDKLSTEKEKRTSELLDKCEVFFAFNKNQYNEGKKKHNISVENKVTSIGVGGFVPVKNIKALEKGFKTIEKWYTEQEKSVKVTIKPKRISYDLYDEMLCVLPPIYHHNGVFQVSEPYNHITVGGKECATYATYQEKNKKYYSLGILTRQQASDYSLK
jgi:hypothetical protein